MANPAEGYESYMVPTLFGPCAENLVREANPKQSERVLDVGCGTGIVARKVASHLGATGGIIGVDCSSNMLAVARTTAAQAGLTVDWRQGNAEQLPFDDRTFELVLCQFALMFMVDKTAALSEIHRVVSEGGRVLVSVWQGLDRHPFYQTLHQVIRERVGISALQDIFALGDKDYLRELVSRAGFRQVEIRPFSITARFPNPEEFIAGEIEVDTAAIPSMQHLEPQARQAIVAAIMKDMQLALNEVTLDNHVVIPFHGQTIKAWP